MSRRDRTRTGTARLVALVLAGLLCGRSSADSRAELLAGYAGPAAALLDHYKALRARYHFETPAGKGERGW